MNHYLRNLKYGVLVVCLVVGVFATWLARPIQAATRTWDGGGVDNNWSTCANWSSDICPVSGDTVVFDGTSSKDSTVNAGFAGTITQVNLNAGYGGTLSLARSLTVSTAFIQAAGSFTADAQTLTIGSLTLSGGNFTASSGTTAITGNLTVTNTPTFVANGGTLSFTSGGSPTYSCGEIDTNFNLVTISKTTGVTVGSDCNLPLGNNPSVVVGNLNTLTLNGTLSGTGTLTISSSNSKLIVNSTANLVGFTGFLSKGLTVNSKSLDFSSYTTFAFDGDLLVTSADVLFPVPTGTIDIDVFSLTSANFTAPLAANMNVSDDLTISADSTFNANGGTLTFNGVNTPTYDCNNVDFNQVVITKGTGVTIQSNCQFPLGNNPVITVGNNASVILNGTLSGSGILTVNGSQDTSILRLETTSSLSGFSGLNLDSLLLNSSTYDFSGYASFALARNFTATSGSAVFPVSDSINIVDFTLTDSSFSAPSTGNMNIGGNFTVSGTSTFTANTSTVTFNGNTGGTYNCNGVEFYRVIISRDASANITSTCTFPLGNDPIITTSGDTITVRGVLAGSGTLTVAGNSLSILNFTDDGTLQGFSALDLQSLTVSGATVDFSSHSPVTIASNVAVSSGSLTLPNNTDINGSLTLSSTGALTAPSGNMFVAGSVSVSGTPSFNANGGTVVFDGGVANISCGTISFNIVSFTGQTGTKTVTNTCDLNLGSNPTVPNSISLSGILRGTGTLSFTTGTLTMNNVATNITGFSDLVTSALTVSGASYDASSLASFTANGAVGVSSGTLTLPGGSNLLSTLTINGGTLGVTTGDIAVASTLSISTGTFNAPTGTLSLGGALTITGTGFNHSNGTVNFTGGAATLSCNNVTFNAVTFNNTAAKTVNSNCNLPLGNNPTVANGIILNGKLNGSGTITQTAGTLQLNSGYTLEGFTGLTGTSNSLTVSGATFIAGSYSPFTLGGDFTLTSSGNFTAPSGTMSVAGNFVHNSGTFTHNSGTVVLNGTSAGQTITGTTSFNNVTKELVSGPAQTLTFPASTTQTIVGTLTLKGFDTSSRLWLRSSSNNTQWRIDPQGNRDILYLDVKDGNNLNATPIQMGGTGSLDSTNNTNFNFGSLTPNDPSNLGPSGVISGVYTSTLKPQFTFQQTDPNSLDTVKFQIQISTNADFSSPVVDYSSALIAQGNTSFTVGQNPGSGTYTVGSSGQSLASGDYYWRVLTTDNNGLSSDYTAGNSGSIAFSIDAEPPAAFTPTLNVTSPTNNTTPTVTFSTTDNVAVDHYHVKVDSGSFFLRTSPYTLPALANGAHTITVRAFDTTGNFTDGVVNVTVDTSQPATFTPTLDVTSPTNNTTPTVSFSTTDPDGIDHYEVKIDEGSFSTQTSPYQLPTLSEGAHTITVRAFDLASNTRDGSVNVTVDTTPPASFTPTLNVTSPTTNHTPILSFSTTDTVSMDHFEVQINSGSFTTQTSPYQLPTLDDGDYTFTVRAFDDAGNTRDGSVSLTVTTDVAPAPFTPTLDVTSPTTNTSPTVTFSTTSDIGIDHYEVQVDSGSFTTQTSPYQVPTLSEGAHTITVRAFDLENNTTDGSVSVTVDTTAPAAFTPTFSQTSPTNDSTPILNFSTTDTVGIDHYEVQIDGGAFTTHSSPYTLSILSDGLHTVVVRAFDGAGNTRDGSANITIDTQAPAAFTPTLNVSSPTSNTRPTVTFSTTDNIAIGFYQVKIDSGSYSTQTSPYQVPTLSEGEHTIYVRARDTAGNITDGSVTVTVDPMPPADFTPTLNVTSPTTNSAPIVSFSTTDNTGIDHYEVKLDAGAFVTQSSPYQLPTLGDGEHTVTVKAFDDDGNTSQGSVTFTIDTTAPAIGYTAPKKTSNGDITNTVITINDTVGIDDSGVSITGAVSNCTQVSPTRVSCSTTISSSGTINIQASDNIGNTSTASITDYVIETVAPVIVITAPTKSSLTTITDTTLVVTDNYAINVSGVTAISGGTIACTQTSATQVNCTATVSASGDLVINADDVAGNADAETEAGYVVTNTAPAAFTPSLNTTALTSNPAPILTFATTDTDGIDRYEVRIDSEAFTTQLSPYQLPTLSDGFHTILVRAYDTLDNFTDGSVSVTVDTAGPLAFTPMLDVTSPTRITTPTVTFFTTDSSGIDHYQLKVNSGSFTTQTSPHLLSALSEGSHTITVRAFDETNRTTDGSVDLVVDLTPPAAFTPTLDVTSPTTNPTPVLSFATTDTVGLDRFEVQVDSGAFSTQTSPFTLPSLSTGDHTITVVAYDLAGNTQTESLALTIQAEATEPSSSSGTSNSSAGTTTNPTAPVCSTPAPGNVAPWLYSAVAESSDAVRLYFTPAEDPVDSYVLEYGFEVGNYPFGTSAVGPRGTSDYLVGSLASNTTYYFRIRGGNGCATGPWSNEISVTTKPLVSFRQLQVVGPAIEVVTPTPPETLAAPTCQTYVVESNDTLWTVAQKLLGDGTKYQEIIDQNLDSYPSLKSSNTLQVGWELVHNCTGEKPRTAEAEQAVIAAEGHKLHLTILDSNQQPVVGAKVTLHSVVQETVTDEQGVAYFTNVEAGEHRLIVDYGNYVGEQSLNISGDTQEIALKITIETKNVLLTPLAGGIIGALVGVIVILLMLVYKMRLKLKSIARK